jgi:hypothetical protein
MHLKPVHLEFYRIKKATPAWANSCFSKDGLKHNLAKDDRLIHSCINAHSGVKSDPGLEANNLISLCRWYVKRGSLFGDPQLIATRGGSNKRRIGYAKKWCEKIAKRNTTP